MSNGKNQTGKIAKVRERGQLTVPMEVRGALGWPEGVILVRITPLPEEDGFKVERIPTPRQEAPRKRLTEEEWDAVFGSMKRISRSGKAVNLTEFLTKDRESH